MFLRVSLASSFFSLLWFWLVMLFSFSFIYLQPLLPRLLCADRRAGRFNYVLFTLLSHFPSLLYFTSLIIVTFSLHFFIFLLILSMSHFYELFYSFCYYTTYFIYFLSWFYYKDLLSLLLCLSSSHLFFLFFPFHGPFIQAIIIPFFHSP